jgi:hypothetical protein
MKYLNPSGFSEGVSNGRMTDTEYAIAVGALVKCQNCRSLYNPDLPHDPDEPAHTCPGQPPF